MNDGEVALRRLLVAGRDGAKASEAIEEDLHARALAVELLVELELVVLAGLVGADDWLHLVRAHLIDQLIRVVARVAEKGLAACVFQQVECGGALVPMPRRQGEEVWIAFRVYKSVDLR